MKKPIVMITTAHNEGAVSRYNETAPFILGILALSRASSRGLSRGELNSGSPTAALLFVFFLILLGLRHNPRQNYLLWGATQFSESRFSARQEKSRREYPLVFSRDFPQYWRKAASENLSGFDSPWLNLNALPRISSGMQPGPPRPPWAWRCKWMPAGHLQICVPSDCRSRQPWWRRLLLHPAPWTR